MNKTAENDTIDGIRLLFGKALAGFLWFNGALVLLANWWLEALPMAAMLAGVLILAGPTSFLAWKYPASGGYRIVSSMALAAVVALLVAVYKNEESGQVLQIDMHMYFFVCLAILAAWLDWRPLVAYAGVVAVHHILLSMTVPLLVFPDGSGFDRIALHAGLVVIETGVLIWLVKRLSLALRDSDALNKERASKEEMTMLRQLAQQQAQAESERRLKTAEMIEKFYEHIGEVSTNLRSALGKLGGATAGLTELTQKSLKASGEAAAGANNAQKSIHEVVETCRVLQGAIEEIGLGIDASEQVVSSAETDARESSAMVAALGDVVGRVSTVIDVIRSVAEQTNLLALNATIEAARAGEAGRGFAVVAQEVKALAGQTAKATDEIARQIGEIQAATEAAVNSTAAFATRIQEVRGATAAILAATEKQKEATNLIEKTVDVAASSAGSVSSEITGATQAAHETARGVQQAEEAAAAMRQQTARLSEVVEILIKNIKAA